MPPNAPTLAAVREMRRRLAEVGPERVRAQGDFERVSIPQDDGNALRDLLVADGARTVIEIGLAYASSALAIAEALLIQEGTTEHLIIDAYQHLFHDAGVKTLDAAGLRERCTLLRERSQLALPKLVGEGVSVDAAFVDGSHIFTNVFVDLYFLRELVRPGGLIILDDCDRRSVATAVRYFELNAGWREQGFQCRTRLRAFRLPELRDAQTFDTLIK